MPQICQINFHFNALECGWVGVFQRFRSVVKSFLCITISVAFKVERHRSYRPVSLEMYARPEYNREQPKKKQQTLHAGVTT